MAVTHRDGAQSCNVPPIELRVVGCPEEVVIEYAALRETVFSGVSPPKGGNSVRFLPWDLWAGMQKRRITTVRLVADGDTECLQVGEVVVPRRQFENYIQQALKVVKLAYKCKLL